MIAEIVVADDIAAWTEQAVSDILALAADSIAERGRFVLCLAGGSTPSSVYDALATDRRSASIDWTAVALLLGDERCVPPDDPASNELMVRQRLLVPLGIDPSQLLRLRGERAPAEAARLAEAELSSLLGGLPAAGPPDRAIDLVLLGLGDNGHTASLFPGLSWRFRPDRWVIEDYVEVASMWRLSLTPTILSAARNVEYLVAGPAKAEIVARVVEGPEDPVVLPAQAIRPERPARWLLDQSAAALLR